MSQFSGDLSGSGCRLQSAGGVSKKPGTVVLLKVMILRALGTWMTVRRNNPLVQMRFFDRLTGLHNRAAMKQLAARMVESSHRSEEPLSFLLVAVDGLLELEARFGPRLRDRALCAVAELLEPLNASGATAARLRSGEFGVLLPGVDAHAAGEVAENLQALVESLRLQEAGQPVGVTVSISIAQMRPEDKNWTQMLCRADVGLMCARSKGANQIVRETGSLRVLPGRRSSLGRNRSVGIQAALP